CFELILLYIFLSYIVIFYLLVIAGVSSSVSAVLAINCCFATSIVSSFIEMTTAASSNIKLTTCMIQYGMMSYRIPYSKVPRGWMLIAKMLITENTRPLMFCGVITCI